MMKFINIIIEIYFNWRVNYFSFDFDFFFFGALLLVFMGGPDGGGVGLFLASNGWLPNDGNAK